MVTYNLHGCVGTDGVRDPRRVARVICDLEPDIAGLQEVDCRTRLADGRSQLDVIAEATGMSAIPGPTMTMGGGFFGNAVLTRFPVTDVKHFDLSFRRREPRAILAATVAIGGLHLRCFVTHFGLRGQERSHQVRLLLDHVGSEPVVLMGDFNEWRPRTTTIADLDAALGRAPAVRSFPSRLPLLKLDRIWVRPVGALLDIEPHGGALARAASDHLPVLARLDKRKL